MHANANPSHAVPSHAGHVFSLLAAARGPEAAAHPGRSGPAAGGKSLKPMGAGPAAGRRSNGGAKSLKPLAR